MRLTAPPRHAGGVRGWAEETRRLLTRDLLLRAARAQPAERQALLFRALHLNLPLVGEVADGLGLTAQQRSRVEHGVLEALAGALRAFDPYGDEDFADYAAPVLERQMVSQLPSVSRRRGRPSPR